MSDFITYLKMSLAGLSAPELSLAPGIAPKCLAGAREFANYGHEPPLALLDNTVWQSGKAGVLFTAAAMYCDDPRVRVPLEVIRAAAAFPNGHGERGTLPTPHGPVSLPRMVTKELSAALEGVIKAVVAWNNGAAQIPVSSLPVQGPVGEIALATLRHADVKVAPFIPAAKLHAAAASFPSWADYLAGEDVLALMDETISGDGTEGLVLTDRRLMYWNYDKGVDVAYAHLTGVERGGGFLSKRVTLVAGVRREQIDVATCAGAVPSLVAFLDGLGRVAPHARMQPPPPPPGPDDPSGAAATMAGLVRVDPRVALVLRLVHESVKKGWMPPASGADLAARASLLQHTLASGRGKRHGALLSPLPHADLAYALSAILGRPTGQGVDGAGAYSLEFATHGKGSTAGAVASSAVGLTLLAVVGVGWVSTPGATVTRVRVRIAEAQGGTAFGVFDADGASPLAKAAPAAYASLVGALADCEAQLLLYRAAYGWNAPPEQLYAQPAGAIEQRVTAMIGPTDLSAFARAG